MVESNVVKVLKYLVENRADSKFISIEESLPNLDRNEKVTLCYEMAKCKLLYIKGGDFGGSSITFFIDGRKTGEFGRMDNNYNPLQAQITIYGIEFLRKELQQMKNQTLNINTGNNSQVQVSIDSKNVLMKNQSQAIEIIDKIIERLFEDYEIDKNVKREAIKEFEKAKDEVENQKLNNNTLNKILSYSDQIASIGSFIGMLTQMFNH